MDQVAQSRRGGSVPELMKGKVFAEHKHKVQYPVLVEPKVDEIRCHVRRLGGGGVEFLSYAGKPLNNLGRFAEQFEAALTLHGLYGLYELDCGVEVRGNFNDSYRYVRSKRLPKDLEDADVVFHLYDLPDSPDGSYLKRRAVLASLLECIPGARLLPQEECCSEGEVHGLYEKYISLGYEGAMVKNPVFMYPRGKRTSDWLKLKPELDMDAVIVGFKEAVCGVAQPAKGLVPGVPLGRVGAVLVRCEDGSEAAPHGVPHELGTDMHLNPEKYLGQWCEFKFMERDRQGGYRHPRFHRLREAK